MKLTFFTITIYFLIRPRDKLLFYWFINFSLIFCYLVKIEQIKCRRKSYGGLTTKQRNRQTTINHLLLQNVTFPTEEEIKQIQLNELQSHSRIDSQS